MTALTDFYTTIRSWMNLGEEEFPDALVDSFVKMAETTLGPLLRVKHMIQIDTGVVAVNRVLLPEDWLELDLVRIINGPVLKFRTREQFYAESEDENHNSGYFTVSGNHLILADNVIDGETTEIHYFQEIPSLGEENNWLMTHYPTLYILSAGIAAQLYGLEDDRAGGWKTLVTEQVQTLNEEYLKSKTGNTSLVAKRNRGFG